jgi:hypothetical protein
LGKLRELGINFGSIDAEETKRKQMPMIDIHFKNHGDSPVTLPLECYVRLSSFASDGDGFPELTTHCNTIAALEGEVGRIKDKLDRIISTAKSRYARS